MATSEASSHQQAEDGIQRKIRVGIDSRGPFSWVRRSAEIEGLDDRWAFGTHGPFQEHYGVQPGEFPPEATTNEVFVAALVACMAGTFAAMLEPRGIVLSGDDLVAEADVDMGPAVDDGRPMIRSVTVQLLARVSEDQRATAERVHGMYAEQCWLTQTLRGSRCELSSTLEFV
jgi:organic hydroperoxide reductase OsmC/OhrA